jgi:hypothetical protein
LVVVLATAVGVSAMVARGNAFADVQTPRLTSALIVDAVLFNDGPAAVYLSNVERDDIHWTPELRSIQAGIKATVAAEGTGYYKSEFAKAMQSGDPSLVQQAMGRVSGTVHTYLEQRYGADRVDDALRTMGVSVDPQAAPRDCIDGPVLVFFIAIVVFIAAVFALPPTGLSTDQRLAAEKLVNDIAVALRTGQ